MRFAALCTACLACLFPVRASAQSCVWRVSSGEQHLFLGGTVHLLRATDYPLPAEFDEAFAAADALWLEMDFAEMQSPAALGLLLRKGVLPAGETLEATLSPEAWTALKDYCAESGLALATMSRFQAGVLIMNIELFELTRLGISQLGVDAHYAGKAAEAGKPTHGFETLAEQMNFITKLSAGRESELVLQTLRHLAKTGEMIDSTIAAWRAGDLTQLDAVLMKEMAADQPAVVEELVVQRNRNWMPKIEELLQSEPVELILVGAGHLPGPDGLLALLKARGCDLEQIVAGTVAR